MSISALERRRRATLRFAWGNLAFAAFCGVFGWVYERFSFGVVSGFMVYAFLPPLAAGLLLALLSGSRWAPDGGTLRLLTWGAATLGVGSIAAGVVAIYGTENRLLTVYPVAGAALLLAAAVRYFWLRRRAGWD